MRTFLMATSATIAIVTAAPVMAQASDPNGGEGGIEEIIVTAQRKEESSQKAGIAIDAVSASDLLDRGVTSATDLTKAVPAISLPSGGATITSIFLRGVGNITTSSYNDPAVTPSYDGVVLGRGGGVFGAAFYDLQRVEVLKGPQGILYGRNATGGAVNVIPQRPKIGETGAGINAGYGNFNALNVDGYVNVATGENSALRVSGTYLEHDGYNRDGSDDAKRGGFRAQFLFEPTTDLSVRLAGDYTHVGGNGVGSLYLGSFAPNGTGGYNFFPVTFDTSEGINTTAANAYRTTVLGAPGFGFLSPLKGPQKTDSTYWGINAEINLKTSIGTLTFIPAYRETKDRSFFNGPGFNLANTNEDIKQLSLEARLGGNTGAIDYVLGGFYFNEKIHANNQYNQEFVLPMQVYDHKTESWALFGQLTYHVTDRFRLIGGARYTSDKKSIDGLLNNFITFCGGLPPANVTPPASFARGCAAPNASPRYPNLLNSADMISWLVTNGWIASTASAQPFPQVFPLLSGAGTILKTHTPISDSGTSSRATWKISAEYDVGDSNLLYATVETGYRAGGFQMAEGRPTYKPEYITAYSIGSKNRFLDNKLQLNFEAFLWKYRDQQITYFAADTSGNLISSNENAGRLTIKGFDVDLIAKPASNTTLSAKVQFLDSKYGALNFITAAPRDNFSCPFTLTGAFAGGAPVKNFDCSGARGLFSPKWTLNFGAEQVVPLSGDLELVGNVNSAWRDDQLGAFEQLAFEYIPAYWTTDLSLTLRNASGSWSVSGYINNLENDRHNLAPQASPLGIAIGHFSAPRTYGIRLSAQF